jgi:hypothetical protein
MLENTVLKKALIAIVAMLVFFMFLAFCMFLHIIEAPSGPCAEEAKLPIPYIPVFGFGDSLAANLSYDVPFPRFAFPGYTAHQLVDAVPLLPNANVGTLVVTAGVNNGIQSCERIQRELDELEAALRNRYPSAKILMIPPSAIWEIGKTDSTDGVHLTPSGYKRLSQQFPLSSAK